MRNAALNPQFKGGQPEIEILAGSQFVLSPLGSWETVFGRAALICSTSPVVFQHLVMMEQMLLLRIEVMVSLMVKVYLDCLMTFWLILVQGII